MRNKVYKQILSIILVIILISVPVFFPSIVGHEINTYATSNTILGQVQMIIPAATAEFVAWLLMTLASMGITISNVSELMTHLQNVDFRDMIQDFWDEYTVTYLGITPLSYKDITTIITTMPAILWNNLRTIANNLFPRNVTVPPEIINNTSLDVVKNSAGKTYSIWKSNTAPSTTAQNEMASLTHVYSGYTLANEVISYNTINVAGVNWNVSTYYDSGWKIAFHRNGVLVSSVLSPVTPYKLYIVPSLYYKYYGGSTDVEGYKYKLNIYAAIGVGNSETGITSWRNVKYIANEDIRESEIYATSNPDVNEVTLGSSINQENILSEQQVIIQNQALLIEQLIDALDETIDDVQDQDLPTTANTYIDTDNQYITNITNVYEGEGEAEGELNPDVPLELPDVPDWEMPGTTLLTKFPFCIPFDLYRSFQMFQATAEIPQFTIPFSITSIGYSTNIVLDMEPYQGLVNMARWFILAFFIVGLIMATRGLIKG